MASRKLSLSDISTGAEDEELPGESGGAEEPAPRQNDEAPPELHIGDPLTPEQPEQDDDGQGQQRPSRRERRADRMREAEEARIRAETERDLLRRQLEERQNQPPPQQHAPPPQQGPDQFDLMEQKIREQYDGLHKEYAARIRAGEQLTDEEVRSYRNRGYELQNQGQTLNTLRTLKRLGIDPQALRQGAQQQPQVNVTQQILAAEFPEIYASQQLMARAGHVFDGLVLDGKDGNSIETSREALRRVREQYGPRQRPEPGPSQRQQLSGLPAGPGRGGGESRSAGGTVKMTAELRAMARAAYPKLYSQDPQKAYQKWANDVGPGFLEDERRMGRG